MKWIQMTLWVQHGPPDTSGGHVVTRRVQSCPRSGPKSARFCTHRPLITTWHGERASPVTSPLIRDPRDNWPASRRWGGLAARGSWAKHPQKQPNIRKYGKIHQITFSASALVRIWGYTLLSWRIILSTTCSFSRLLLVRKYMSCCSRWQYDWSRDQKKKNKPQQLISKPFHLPKSG